MAQSVSPGRTVYFVGGRGGATEYGTTICEPTGRRSGFRRPRFRASSSCHRRPLPSREAANFQSESPGLTVTMVRFPEIAGDGETRCSDGAGSALGAKGAGTIGRGAETTGGAGKTRGRSKGDRLTNGRIGATTRGAGLTTVGGTGTPGGTKGWAGALGDARTGASAKGR